MDSIQKKIYVYIHICTIESWEQVVRNMWNKINSSGLLKACTEVRIIVLGDQLQQVKAIMCDPKVTVLYHGTDLSLYERPILQHMRASADHEDFYAFYCHSKGVREKNRAYRTNITDWTNMMMYFLVDKHQECIQLLEGSVDAVGTDLINASRLVLATSATNQNATDSMHFSGNFWWVRSSYLKTLSRTIAPKYLDPELWIGTGTGTLHSRHQSIRFDHYHHPYPKSRYENINRHRQLRITHPLPPKTSVSYPIAKPFTPKPVQTPPQPKPVQAPIPQSSPTPPDFLKMSATELAALLRTNPQQAEALKAHLRQFDAQTLAATVIPKRKIYVYLHVCTKGTWEIVLRTLHEKLSHSGLLNKVDKVFVTVLGNDVAKVKGILANPKYTIAFHSVNMGLYERNCLLMLREHSAREDFYVLYLHTKGITKQRYPGVGDWLHYMLYFNVERHNDCIQQLEKYDTCGVNLNKALDWVLRNSATLKDVNKSHHYSGNFWWARSTYIRTLPNSIGPKYIDPELWIGSVAKKNMVSLWQSNVDHYKVRYPPPTYRNKPLKHFVHTTT